MLVGLAVVGTRVASSPSWVRLFDNVHWTVGYGTGAVLAWTGWWRNRQAVQRWFAVGTTAYFVGQLLWDVQVAVGWNPFPGPSDIFFSALGPCLALGLTRELRGMPKPALWAAGLDLLGIAAAALAYTLALYLPLRGATGTLVTATMVAYPVFLSTALGAGVLLVLSRCLRLTPALGLFLTALLTDAVLWAQWNLKTLENTLGDGIFLNYVFSFAAIGLGVGAALWSPREVESPRVERVYFVVHSALPVLLALGAGVALQQSPALPAAVAPWVQGCSLLIVVSAVVRQSLLLAERQKRLDAERKARVLAEQYRAVLVRQEQAQRLEALGTLAAGVAHDFNNLLMGIRGHAELARRDAAEGPASWEAIQTACVRGGEIVRGMLSFGRSQGGSEPRRMDLATSIQESLRLLRALIPSSVVFETALAHDTPAVMADPAQMQQILMNMFSNAADAIGNRPGRTTIRAARRRLEEGNPFGLEAGVYAEMVISDTGKGMDEETRRRIFEPFFSTKGPEKGTGMGLAVVHGIVAGAGGAVECESAPGAGTRFTLLWPAALEPAGDASPSPAPKSPPLEAVTPTGAEILIVDDEPAIASAMARYFRKRGMPATDSNNPLEALALVRADSGRFSAVVCDLTMPGMRGDELCAAIREIAPDLPVILSSGAETSDVSNAAFFAVLTKPYSLDDLAHVLARSLARPPARKGERGTDKAPP